MELANDHYPVDTPNSLLERMSHKRGVRSIIAVDRRNHTIIKSFVQNSGNNTNLSTSSLPSDESGITSNSSTTQQRSGSGSSRSSGGSSLNVNATAELACQLIISADGLVKEHIDGGEEVQLMRLRLHKSELVIVANEKYLLVTIHEPTQAGEGIDHGKLFSAFVSSKN